MQTLPTSYQQFIHLSRYSRWIEDKKRRETWPETVDRYISFFKKRFNNISDEIFEELRNGILNLEVMPSMRALMTAGKALEKDEIAGFNCSFTAIDHLYAFDEILYILTCGTGVGFSVENRYISKLPEIPQELYPTDTIIRVADSRIGWATALRELISLLYAGKIPQFDFSKIRPKGARLKTFGGRASGPEPLKELFVFIINLFKKSTGRKLKSVECHDIVCKIADIVVVGGVRRSALISFSDLHDEEMRHAKSGQWWEHNVQRALANNSAMYLSKPELSEFIEECLSLYLSKSGERGIGNFSNMQKVLPERRDFTKVVGSNPCFEILLRNCGLCNLSEVVVRSTDNVLDLKRKVRLAAILGTFQSTLTNFRYVRKIWKQNAEEERLLGVSLTGILDNLDVFVSNETLTELRDYAVQINKEFAELLEINASVCVTCVKPSGTVSQLVDSSSGIHPRYSPYYIRSVRNDKKDPLSQFMIDIGIPYEVDVTKPDANYVFYFPMKSPEGAITREKFNAIQQLELWKKFKQNWAEHTVSITVYVKENEWLDVFAWVYKNFDYITGISFLPYSDFVYKQAPYTECTKEEYENMLEKMPKNIDWSKLSDYEKEDGTTSSKELACVSGICEI